MGRSTETRAVGLGAALGVALTLLAVPASSAGSEAGPSGVFRLDVRIASRTELPFYGSARSATVSTYLVEIQRTGAGWVQSHRVCAAHIEGGSALVRTELPERFVRALEERSYPVSLAPGAPARANASPGWSYRADMGLEHVGYLPRSAVLELPRAPEDPAVIDWDRDGRPGATVHLSVPLFEGELYVVQRGRSLLEGHLAADGSGAGRVRVAEFGQRVIGARPWFLGRTPSIEIDPERSRFTLARLPDGATCSSLVREARS